MKIEDVKIGRRYKTCGSGVARIVEDIDLASKHVLFNFGWVSAECIEPVDESPKEVPTASYDGKNYIPPHFPLSIADTPVSQMTYRMYLIAQGFAGWAADSRADDRDLPAIPIAADELIAEMEKTKK